MPLVWKDRVRQAVTAGGTGALTLGAADAGHQAFAAAEDGALVPYVVEDGNAWEIGLGTYTHASTSLARTVRYASSTGAALDVSTAARVFLDLSAVGAAAADAAAHAVLPGGRLTLVAGTPVPNTDASGSTIRYAPYVSEYVPLWDGQRWRPTIFAETALTLAGLLTERLYDLYAFRTAAGLLALELGTVWTNDSTPAAAPTLQNGRLCRAGDPTRLYLGTIRTTSATSTEDSVRRRLVWNMYNRRPRVLRHLDATASWSYSGTTFRQARGSSLNQIDLVAGISEDAVDIAIGVVASGTAVAGQLGVGVNSTTSNSANAMGSQSIAIGGSSATGFGLATTKLNTTPPRGYTSFIWLEQSSGSAAVTFYGSSSGPGYTAGMMGTWFS